MINQYRTPLTIVFILLVFGFLIAGGLVRNMILIILAFGSFLSALIVSMHDIDEDGPGGVAGYVPGPHPDPKGTKTARGLIVTWFLVILLVLAFPYFGWATIVPVFTMDTSWLVPVFILIAVMAYFTSRR